MHSEPHHTKAGNNPSNSQLVMSIHIQCKIQSLLTDYLQTTSLDVSHFEPHKITVHIIANKQSLSNENILPKYFSLLLSEWIGVIVKVRFVVVGEQPLDIRMVTLQELKVSFLFVEYLQSFVCQGMRSFEKIELYVIEGCLSQFLHSAAIGSLLLQTHSYRFPHSSYFQRMQTTVVIPDTDTQRAKDTGSSKEFTGEAPSTEGELHSDVLTLITNNMSEVFVKAIRQSINVQQNEQFRLELTSVLSEPGNQASKIDVQEKVESIMPLKPLNLQAKNNIKKDNSSLLEPPKISNSPLSIDLSNSYKDSSHIGPTNSQIGCRTYEFSLKNNQKSCEALFITFGLYSIQNNFEIVSAASHQTVIRKKNKINPFQGFLRMCCISPGTTQVYQLKQRSISTVGYLPRIMVTLIQNEGTEAQFVSIKSQLLKKFWQINQINLQREVYMNFFKQSHESTTLKDLQQEFKQIKQKGDQYVMEITLQRVYQTIDTLIDALTVRLNTAPHPQDSRQINQFVFQQSGIIQTYRNIWKGKQDKLQSKKSKLATNLWHQQCFQKLKAGDKLRLRKDDQPDTTKDWFPYKQAIQKLQQISIHILPTDKLSCVDQYFQTIKLCYKQHHNEQLVIEDMDEVLPVHAYTLIYSKLENIYSSIKLLEYYCRRVENKSNSIQILSNLYLAAELISGIDI